ncbi:hypothetical protein IC582_028359 [Cucumis melo]|uniref:Heat shock 70 kDa protein 16-like n=1 Tax=Cucumis melo TaxID=3656 RepID=A0A1S3CH62_CUCME|nr:heat shock 70 kDa protein 16-like [Cucumis melo]
MTVLQLHLAMEFIKQISQIQVQDSFPFSIGFSSDADPISLGLNNVLFPKGQHIPNTKVLSFLRNSLFHLEAVYSNPDELPPGMSSKIDCFTIGPFQGSNNSNSRVKVRVRLNMNGIITVESATTIEDTIDQQIPRRDVTHSNIEKMEIDFVDSFHSEVLKTFLSVLKKLYMHQKYGFAYLWRGEAQMKRCGRGARLPPGTVGAKAPKARALLFGLGYN